jgi:hypothetical protein
MNFAGNSSMLVVAGFVTAVNQDVIAGHFDLKN